MLWRVNDMKKNLTYISLFCGALLLSACATIGAMPTDVASELNYTAEIKEKYKANEEWWTQYNNAELNRLVDLSLANNPDYLKAAININKELYNLNLATSDLFPTLSGGMNASGQRQISTRDNFASNFSGETGLSYEADLYGKIRDLQDAQKFEYEATVMDKESARLSLINSVVDLYFNLEYLQNSKDVTQENIKNYEDILKITETKYKSGKIDNLEYLQAKQSLLSEQNRLLEIETQFKEMETSLKNILNLRQEEPLNIQFGNL